MNKLYLSSSDVRDVAREFHVKPRTLLKAVAANWPRGRENANRARQLILDAANAGGPGMASRGDAANAQILRLVRPSWPLPHGTRVEVEDETWWWVDESRGSYSATLVTKQDARKAITERLGADIPKWERHYYELLVRYLPETPA